MEVTFISDIRSDPVSDRVYSAVISPWILRFTCKNVKFTPFFFYVLGFLDAMYPALLFSLMNDFHSYAGLWEITPVAFPKIVFINIHLMA
jgi:hypothetical protein